MCSAHVERFVTLRSRLLVALAAMMLCASCPLVGNQQTTDSAQQRPQIVVVAQK